MEITKGAPIKIYMDTDTIEMEYCALPITDLTYRFLYRFSKPIEMVWMTDGAITHALLDQRKRSLDEMMEEFALIKFKEMILTNTKEENIPDEAKWLIQFKKSKTYRCHIVRMP